MRQVSMMMVAAACVLLATGCAGFRGSGGAVGRGDSGTLQRELESLNKELFEARQKDAARVKQIAESAKLIQELRRERERAQDQIRDLQKRIQTLQRTLEEVLKGDIAKLGD